MIAKVSTLAELQAEVPRIIEELGEPGIVLLKGEMGAGKTTLINLICRHLGSSSELSSPTFALVNEYELDQDTIYHFDFYRIDSEEEALDMGVEEYFESGYWCFVEWPDRIQSLLPPNSRSIRIELDGDKRLISVS